MKKRREAKKSASIGSIFFAGMKEDKVSELSRAMAYRELSAVESIINNLDPKDKDDKALLEEVLTCCLANIKYECIKYGLQTTEQQINNANFVYWTILTTPLMDKLGGVLTSESSNLEYDLKIGNRVNIKHEQLMSSLSKSISSNYNSSPEASETILRTNSPVKTVDGQVIIDPVVMRSILLIHTEKANEKTQESVRN